MAFHKVVTDAAISSLFSGIAPLNKQYQLVHKPALSSFELDKAPKSKLILLKGEEIMYPAEHSEVLTQVMPHSSY